MNLSYYYCNNILEPIDDCGSPAFLRNLRRDLDRVNVMRAKAKRKIAGHIRLLMTAQLAIALTILSTQQLSAMESDDGWENLKRITRDRSYTIISRDSKCLVGMLAAVDSKSIWIVGESKSAEIPRTAVLRITDVSSELARDVIYSGRSSWIDVEGAIPQGSEYLHVQMKTGEQWTWKQPKVTSESIVFGNKSVVKRDVRRVWYVRYKPTTATEDYVRHENATLLAPRLWFDGLILGKIRVPLYDSEREADESPIACHLAATPGESR